MSSQYFYLMYFIAISSQLNFINAARQWSCAVANKYADWPGKMTMKQVEQSLAMFRKSCAEKLSVNAALIDGLRKGEWPDDHKELKCFTLCIAQTAGTLNKKNELVEAKVKKQIETQLPQNLRALALGALNACKDIQKGYKDPCDKMYYSTKCMYDFSPKDFLYC